MTYTKAKIFNITLKNLRISQTIQNGNQNDRNTIILNEFYESAKEQVLKGFDWNFASTYRELASTQNSVSQNPHFLYEYDYPNDCLFAREIVSPFKNEEIEFEVATNVQFQKIINTNSNPAILRYTRLIDNESFFPAEFVMTLSWYLAFLAAPAICATRTIQSDCLNIYNSMIKNAKRLNAQEGFVDFHTECSWLNCRD